MSTITDAIMQQVSEQVKKAVEAVSSASPLPRFEYVPTVGCEPPRRHEPETSPRRKAPHANGDRQSREENRDHFIGANAHPNYHPGHGRPAKSTRPLRRMQHTLDELLGVKSKNRPHRLREGSPTDNELPSAVLIDEECSTEIAATITVRYVEGITRSGWKAQLWGPQQVLIAEQGSRVTVPTMVFGGEQGPRFISPHNDPLVDCLKKLTYPGRDIVSLVHPILGLGGQEVNPTGTIRLLLRFGDKVRAKNLEVDFLVMDVPTAYNIILGRPTWHKVKAVIAPYVLQLQFEADDGSVGTMQGE
ncbi:hypothetical protein Cgig2_026611 [Carnegiea gigantea]|uniref:Uncharacterized protein n=1 Tax=Carnegiea gigantea TaxID=171969 RepID=A0A9Q1KKL5_9CARY|nr:hypothetical protein Cgig2_026611 [Carnegiea gigantea]